MTVLSCLESSGTLPECYSTRQNNQKLYICVVLWGDIHVSRQGRGRSSGYDFYLISRVPIYQTA